MYTNTERVHDFDVYTWINRLIEPYKKGSVHGISINFGGSNPSNSSNKPEYSVISMANSDAYAAPKAKTDSIIPILLRTSTSTREFPYEYAAIDRKLHQSSVHSYTVFWK